MERDVPEAGCPLGPNVDGVPLITAAIVPVMVSPSSGSRIDSMLDLFFHIGSIRHHQTDNFLGRLLNRLAGDIHNWPPISFAEA